MWVTLIGSHSAYLPNPLPLLKMVAWSILDRAHFSRPPTGTSRHAISPSKGLPIFLTSRLGGGQGCPLLRASNEHSFIVRVLRARRAPGRFLRSLLREQGISTGVIPSHLLGRVLLGVSKITITGQGKIRFTPLMRVFKIPRFLDVNRFESQAVESPID